MELCKYTLFSTWGWIPLPETVTASSLGPRGGYAVVLSPKGSWGAVCPLLWCTRCTIRFKRQVGNRESQPGKHAAVCPYSWGEGNSPQPCMGRLCNGSAACNYEARLVCVCLSHRCPRVQIFMQGSMLLNKTCLLAVFISVVIYFEEIYADTPFISRLLSKSPLRIRRAGYRTEQRGRAAGGEPGGAGRLRGAGRSGGSRRGWARSSEAAGAAGDARGSRGGAWGRGGRGGRLLLLSCSSFSVFPRLARYCLQSASGRLREERRLVSVFLSPFSTRSPCA